MTEELSAANLRSCSWAEIEFINFSIKPDRALPGLPSKISPTVLA